ncbi:MAG TPA: pyruvate ferredoxin oxidoreductase [Firmicutes bacterium]|jgi:pyruvate ferredoxin oxidoreductase alpha subunit|nr:pyruvate ferredoxin oxidoreductase [Bacillota bacterium]
MTKQLGMEVSFAAAEAVKLAGVDVIAAYPITPQTHIVERLSDYVANGELDAEFIPVESEHSALSVCLGSEAAGARSFTCTSSQGLALMNEIVYIAPAVRLPLVMILVNRSLSGPLSIWNDHSDVMSVRDTGWIQLFVENSQEVFDHVFIAYKIAEDQDVLLPVMLNLDGFTLSHMFEPVQMVDAGVIRQYLPPYSPKYTLHPDKPLTMGAFAGPEVYPEIKKAQDEALKASYPHILKAWDKWGKLSGRYYRPIEELHTGDAETLFLTMGSFGETAAEAVELMRSQGRKVGLLKLRLWRPFPFKELCRAVKGARRLIVLDRAVSYGGPGGPVAAEIRSALYNLGNKPQIYNYIVGLGGRDVDVRDYLQIYETAEQSSEYQIYGARE